MNQTHTNHTYFLRHPMSWVGQILSFCSLNHLVSNSISLTFSKYRYHPQSFKDDRTTFTLPCWQLTDATLLDMLSSLTYGEELAFHSQFFDFGKTYHLPLIDFGNVDRGIIDSSVLKELAAHWNMSFSIYNSGRSYHAYGNKLISHEEWLHFMGSILLLNKPSGFKLVDERWVGHRIMAGYSALRWSCNTTQYKRMPTYVGFLNPNGLFFEPNPGAHIAGN